MSDLLEILKQLAGHAWDALSSLEEERFDVLSKAKLQDSFHPVLLVRRATVMNEYSGFSGEDTSRTPVERGMEFEVSFST